MIYIIKNVAHLHIVNTISINVKNPITENAVYALLIINNERLREIGKENKLVRQIIDLALLSNGMLKGKNLSDFIQRSISLIEK